MNRKESGIKKRKPVVVFICTHNACRSQIAEAFGRVMAGDVFTSYSAGTYSKDAINPDVVRLMAEKYDIDVIKNGQRPKMISELPRADWVITMGCGVQCPVVRGRHHEDWGLEDPTGKDDAAYIDVMEQIRRYIARLKEKIEQEDDV